MFQQKNLWYHKLKNRFRIFYFLLFTFYLVSCEHNNLYERIANIPGAAWKSDFTPSFSFDISDTTAAYNLYVTIRHTNTYPFNNIWMQAGLQLPGDTLMQQPLDIELAAADHWLGTGMDDIFEFRKMISQHPVHFKRSGKAIFSLKNMMRQDPLTGVLQVGMRVEKVE